MKKVFTKHFQYTGTDDYDSSLDDQINQFLGQESIDTDRIINIKYAGHSSLGVNTYSALLIYKEK
ncbi:hypothetical protein DMA11_01685 [Marinilabiliaceae bacterium JC017]|nr:hypothetical protein DMA11_01685 [Marinilabiliaceae bacterium JC017]